MAPTVMLDGLQVVLLRTCVCVVHLVWGVVFSKWSRTRKSNTCRETVFAVLALNTLISSSMLVYLVQQRGWATFFAALWFFLLGYRVCVYGLTGSIASGKSTVTSWLQTELGSAIIDADAIAHQVLEFPNKAFTKVVEEFGTTVLCQNASVPRIDRKALRDLVFADSTKRALLNKITHPYIVREIMWQVFKYRVVQWRSTVVLDAALLFETHLHWLCAPVVVVCVDEQSQLSRLMKRDGEKCSLRTLKEMIRVQMPVADKCKRADFVVNNSGTMEQLYDELATTFGKDFGRQMFAGGTTQGKKDSHA